MTVQYKITNLERTIPDGTVVAVQWSAQLKDEAFAASTCGSLTLERDEDSDTFIQFEDLTEEIVIEWLKQTINIEEIESNLATQIANQKRPKTAFGMPWIDSVPVQFVE